jgi:tRNA(Ile)-lysidine synthase
MAIAHVRGGAHNITAAHVQAVLSLLHRQSGKAMHIPGLVAYKEYGRIAIAVPAPPKAFGTYALSVPMAIDIPELQGTLTLSHTAPNKLQPPNAKNTIMGCTKVFEYGIVEEALFLRPRRPGDRILLSGAKPFTKKLQDYFTDAKIPKHQRDAIPVLACGSDVLWVLDKKGPTSEKYSPRGDGTPGQEKKYKNPLWVTLWRDADDARTHDQP